VRLRDDVGIDRIAWECDYPHSDTTWPRAPEALLANLAGAANDEIDRISHLNAMRWFEFDPFHDDERARQLHGRRIARSQAQGVDLSLLRGKGGKAPGVDAAGPVTAGDVMKQLATALDGQVNRST
jgi:hypothetical protein